MTTRSLLIIAGLTMREASRRKVLLALAAMTVLLLALSAWGSPRSTPSSAGSPPVR
jgi:hypothetical protein